MNILSANQRSPRATVQTSSHSPVSGKLIMVGKFIFVAFTIAMLLNAYIYLNMKLAETQQQIRRTERIIHETDREIAQLRILREELMAWPHIKNMIARFDLKLHVPNPGQVMTMTNLSQEQSAGNSLESVAAVRLPSHGVIHN